MSYLASYIGHLIYGLCRRHFCNSLLLSLCTTSAHGILSFLGTHFIRFRWGWSQPPPPQVMGIRGYVPWPGQPGHHIHQVAMIGLGIGSWLNVRAIIVLSEDFLSEPIRKDSFFLLKFLGTVGIKWSSSLLCRKRPSKRERRHLSPWIQLWQRMNKYLFKEGQEE